MTNPANRKYLLGRLVDQSVRTWGAVNAFTAAVPNAAKRPEHRAALAMLARAGKWIESDHIDIDGPYAADLLCLLAELVEARKQLEVLMSEMSAADLRSTAT